jgi:cytoskeleton protein RodZ
MMTVGETFRRERLKRNLDLEQVSRELKISPRFLEAIEDEDFEKLPGGVFAKAFIRQYGKLLGLNDDELAAQLQQTFEPPPSEPSSSAPPSSFQGGVAPIQVPRMEEWQSVGDQGFRWSGSLSAAIVVVLVMLICSAVYAWLQRPRTPVTAVHNNPAPVQTAAANAATPPSSTPSAPANPPAPSVTSAQPVTSQTPSAPPSAPPSGSQPAPSQPAANPPATPPTVAQSTPAQPTAAPPNANPAQPNANPEAAPTTPGPVHVEIKADRPVWVLARIDGKYAFSGTLDSAQTRTVDGASNVVLRIGNAGGVTLILNGKPVGPVGPEGQVRTIQFTSGGFQIVPAKPPSPPDGPVERL